jgi:hypothetical protein
MRTSIKKTSPVALAFVPFGIFDTKGREVGVVVRTWEVVATEVPNTNTCWHNHIKEVGEYFAVSIQSTRNGKGYGASQPDSYFKTQAEADVAIEKRIKSTRARYAKQFPQV